jgi:hypothetical protein
MLPTDSSGVGIDRSGSLVLVGLALAVLAAKLQSGAPDAS